MEKDKNLLEEKRNKIIQASINVFVKKGFFKTQMEDIAREAGVAKGTLYLYFKSKEELFASFFENIFEQAFSDIEKIKNMSASAIDKLKIIVKNQIEFCQKNLELFMMIDRELHNMDKTLKMTNTKKIMKKYEDIIYSLSEIVKQGIKEKSIKNIDPVLISVILIDAVKSVVFRNVKFHSKEKLTNQIPVVLDILLNGIGR
ncbi:MAG: TetR/AcrR family transcriptional regulator [Endomicrobiia bacterium]